MEAILNVIYDLLPSRCIFRLTCINHSFKSMILSDKTLWKYLSRKIVTIPYTSPTISVQRLVSLVSLGLTHSKICIECGRIGKRRHITHKGKMITVCSPCHEDENGFMGTLPSTKLTPRQNIRIHACNIRPCHTFVDTHSTISLYLCSDLVGERGLKHIRFEGLELDSNEED